MAKTFNIFNKQYPVNSFYTQYPVANTNTSTGAFPDSGAPLALFGGTWEKQWNSEGIVFQTEGYDGEGSNIRSNGLINGQMQGHYHSFTPTHGSVAGSGAVAGTDDTTIITPLKLRNGLNATGSAPIYACRAWVNFDGTQVAASMIKASGNVGSITDNATGDYTINFTVNMNDTYYCLSATGLLGGAGAMLGFNNDTPTKTVGTIRIYSSTNSNNTLIDCAQASVAIFR